MRGADSANLGVRTKVPRSFFSVAGGGRRRGLRRLDTPGQEQERMMMVVHEGMVDDGTPSSVFSEQAD